MRGPTATLLTLGALALLSAPPPSYADPADPPETHRPRRHRSAEILLDMNDAPRGDREPGGNFRLRKRYGLEYSHSFATREGPPLVFSVQGPGMPRKRLGISFEVRF